MAELAPQRQPQPQPETRPDFKEGLTRPADMTEEEARKINKTVPHKRPGLPLKKDRMPQGPNFPPDDFNKKGEPPNQYPNPEIPNTNPDIFDEAQAARNVIEKGGADNGIKR